MAYTGMAYMAGLPRAQFMLGMLHMRGQGVKDSWAQAVGPFHAAAQSGDPAAEYFAGGPPSSTLDPVPYTLP